MSERGPNVMSEKRTAETAPSRAILMWITAVGVASVAACAAQQPLLTGKAAMGDWTTDAPGVRRKITRADLPPPNATRSVDNGPREVPRPEGRLPQAPAGFKVNLFRGGLSEPRALVTAPNGDLFIAESRANRVRVLRDRDGDGVAETDSIYASDLALPFGIAFYPRGDNPTHVYVANTHSVVRFPYRKDDLKAAGAPEMIVPDIPGFGQLRGGGHWTRDIDFSLDSKRMWVSVGSLSNVSDDSREVRRAQILEFTPEGRGERPYATGIRNPVGLAVHPQTGDLWTSVNERDALGDHLPPDYITRVQEGGFYGWPWFYLGPDWDPRHQGKRPELREKVITPDVLVQSHSASLDLCFYTGNNFPAEYRRDIFAAFHGSWNRSRRTGYKVVRVPLERAASSGVYEDFLTGFVLNANEVWGRPVGVTTGRDGALYVTDDASDSVWRVAYTGSRRNP